MTCFEDITLIAPDDFPSYGAANQLTSITKPHGSFTTFSYDNNGNMVEELIWKALKGKGKKDPSLDENRAYFYDFDDRLWKVEISKGKSEAMTD